VGHSLQAANPKEKFLAGAAALHVVEKWKPGWRTTKTSSIMSRLSLFEAMSMMAKMFNSFPFASTTNTTLF